MWMHGIGIMWKAQVVIYGLTFCLIVVTSVKNPDKPSEYHCTVAGFWKFRPKTKRSFFIRKNKYHSIELMINKLHGLSPSGGLVSPSGGFASLFFDQVGYFASIKLCQALSRQGAIIKIPVVRCHYLLCSSAQLLWTDFNIN